jgi:hypothetical protein
METQQMMKLLLARMNAIIKEHMQEMKTDRKADQARMEVKIDANRQRDRENLKGMVEEMNAKVDGNQPEMRSTVCAIRSELDETTACNGATETGPNPGMMQSKEEHQEIPKGEAVVMPAGGSRKRRRVCNLAAERRQKRKERTWGKSGFRRKSAAACRKVSHLAKWHGGELGPRRIVGPGRE